MTLLGYALSPIIVYIFIRLIVSATIYAGFYL